MLLIGVAPNPPVPPLVLPEVAVDAVGAAVVVVVVAVLLAGVVEELLLEPPPAPMFLRRSLTPLGMALISLTAKLVTDSEMLASRFGLCFLTTEEGLGVPRFTFWFWATCLAAWSARAGFV